ncbi:Hypothetical predicted protein, partial [Olea europaea subsp. europaea]
YRWLVFVAAMWIQSCAGIGLGVATDLGDSVGFVAGSLSEILPWAALLIGAIQNFAGYGLVSLIVTGRAPVLPLWAMCILIYVGTNGEHASTMPHLYLVCKTSPKARILSWDTKGFCRVGWGNFDSDIHSDAFPDHASLIFMVAIGPTMVFIALMFIVRTVGDFWLMFFSLFGSGSGSGSGLTGSIGGGYLSKRIVRSHCQQHIYMTVKQRSKLTASITDNKV